jgi:16S rRNA (guanine527-N7)-methyltransferase
VVEDIVGKLGLPLEVHHARAEDLLERFSCDTLVARAVAPLAKLLTWFAPRWNAFRRLLVIKGPGWVEERREARERGLFKGLQLRKLETYTTPSTDAESVVLEIKPAA